MHISELYKQDKGVISFEVFPSRTTEGIDILIGELEKLKQFNPGFISVTYGAGGSTQGRSLLLLDKIIHELKLEVMPHLTCIGSSQGSILAFLEKVRSWGVRNILALRGDLPKNPEYVPESDFFKHADDLIRFAKMNTDFDVAVAGFPQKHPEAKTIKDDIYYLKQKVEAGAAAVVTQLFFDNADLYSYVDKVRGAGIEVPVVPGIWTLTSPNQTQKILECGAKINPELLSKMQSGKYSDSDKQNIGVEYAVAQINDLKQKGFKHFHLYTLNRAEFVSRVLKAL